MVVRCRPSHRASTSRCLLTCRMELGNHASTQCPQPRPVRHPAPKDIQVSTCGPQPFMRLITSTLLDRGVRAARIRYEGFRPDLWAAQTAPGAES
jgi:ferredoxin-NADP reductase